MHLSAGPVAAANACRLESWCSLALTLGGGTEAGAVGGDGRLKFTYKTVGLQNVCTQQPAKVYIGLHSTYADGMRSCVDAVKQCLQVLHNAQTPDLCIVDD